MPAPLFPAFIKLADRACLVVGAGEVARSKVESLLNAGALVTVVAPLAISNIENLARSRTLVWLKREFQIDDLNGLFLVIAATSSSAINRAVFLEADDRPGGRAQIRRGPLRSRTAPRNNRTSPPVRPQPPPPGEQKN